MVVEALAGWLVGQLADAGRRGLKEWLLGTDLEQSLRAAAADAIEATARELRSGSPTADDPQGTGDLVRVIGEVFEEAPTPGESLLGSATLLEGLQAGIASRLAVLDDPDITETGQSWAALNGVDVPALTDVLTRQLLRAIIERGAVGGPLTPLAAQLNDDLTHLQGHELSTSLARIAQDLQSALERLDRLDQARSIPAKIRPPLGWPIRELTDPFALEVHRAIAVPGAVGSLPDLPTYIERDHDRQLQAVIRRAVGGQSSAAVLVGGSSTGKTRACWEAVQDLPTDWRLWHPIDPSGPEAVVDALPVVGPRTVIWLNETQRYLLTPGSDLGERVAAKLRELLRDSTRSPVLVLGTIWPKNWATLTTLPAPGQPDPHIEARMLLADTYIPVPETFTGHALRAVQAAAGGDPRLAEAVRGNDDGHITQFLAGAPALLERYRTAPPAAKALIETAMDARRLGHGPDISHGLLEAAAPGYLTDQQWNGLEEDWLKQALAYCAESSRGPIGPLTRVRPRPGRPAPPAHPDYRLADYLEQIGHIKRLTVLPPAALWDAFPEHAGAADLLQIAEEAERRSLYRHALRFWRRAATEGSTRALRRAAELLERVDRVEEAITSYQRAAELGDAQARSRAAELFQRSGRTDEAIDWLQSRTSEADKPDALKEAADLLRRTGRIREAIGMYQAAAEAGNLDALSQAVQLLESNGRVDEAIGWLQARAREADKPYALEQAAGLLERTGRLQEAISLYQAAAEAGNLDAYWDAAELLEHLDRFDEAADLYRQAAEAGNPNAYWPAASLLKAQGRLEEAISWLQTRATKAGDDDALGYAATLLESVGRHEEAISWLQTVATNTHNRHAIRRAAELLERTGHIDEALDTYKKLVKADNPCTQKPVIKLLKAAGRIDEAIAWLQGLSAKARTSHALEQVAKLLEDAGRIDEAISMYQHIAEAGDRHGTRRAAELLKAAGRIDEAIGWLETGIPKAASPYALEQAGHLLRRAGRIEEAIGTYRRAAEAGNLDALSEAVQLLARSGRTDEAIDWLRTSAAQTAKSVALERAARLLQEANRIDEAIAVYKEAADAGEPKALEQAADLLEEAGRIEDAIATYQDAADAGELDALEQMARLMELTGRIDEAIDMHQRAAEAGDPRGLQRAGRLLRRVGRHEEALRLDRYGLEPGGHIAKEWQ